jgi:hypothetical protein
MNSIHQMDDTILYKINHESGICEIGSHGITIENRWMTFLNRIKIIFIEHCNDLENTSANVAILWATIVNSLEVEKLPETNYEAFQWQSSS